MTYADASGNGAPDYSPFPFDVECDLYSGYVRDLYPVDGDPLETYDFGSASTKNGLRPYASTAYVIKTADWFRYGLTPSAAVKDFTADSRGRFLSAERRTTYIAGYADGNSFGCVRQAGQPMDDSRRGIMDPGAPAGRWLTISAVDTAALDATGWKTLETAAGPQQVALCLIGLLAIVPSLLGRRRGIFGKRAGRGRRFHTGRYRIN